MNYAPFTGTVAHVTVQPPDQQPMPANPRSYFLCLSPASIRLRRPRQPRRLSCHKFSHPVPVRQRCAIGQQRETIGLRRTPPPSAV